MNMMTCGIALFTTIACVGVLAEVETLSQTGMILMSLIAGSGGLAVNLANFRKDDELCPRLIAKQMLASLPTAAFISPQVTAFVAWYMKTEPNLNLLSSVAFVVGLAGSHMISTYGKPILDVVGKFGLRRAAREVGIDIEIDQSAHDTPDNRNDETVKGQ